MVMVLYCYKGCLVTWSDLNTTRCPVLYSHSANNNSQISYTKYCNVCYAKTPSEDDEFQAGEGVAEVYENHFLRTYGSKLIQNVK